MVLKDNYNRFRLTLVSNLLTVLLLFMASPLIHAQSKCSQILLTEQPSQLIPLSTFESDFSFVFSHLPESAKDKLRRVLTIGENRGFDNAPITKFLAEIIRKTQEGINSFNYSNGMWLKGYVELKKGTLTLGITSINFEPKWYHKFGVTVSGKSHGLNLAYSRVLYAIIKGIVARSATDDQIKVVEIKAHLVINSTLKQMLTEFGFVSFHTGLPLTREEINGSGKLLKILLPLDWSQRH